MYKLIRIVFFISLALVISSNCLQAAWPWASKDFIIINGISYSAEDYKQWWRSWREADSQVPEGPDSFLEWKLLVQEAKSMELYQDPSYKRKMDVFLKARTRMLLKYEEVDSKTRVTDQDIRDRFNSDYNPTWNFTVLYFDSQDTAAKAHDALSNGIYTFDQLQSRSAVEGGPDQWKQYRASPINLRNAPSDFSVLNDMAAGEISKPLVSENSAILIRLDSRLSPEPDYYLKHFEQIKKQIWDEQQAKFTTELLAELRKKYNVQVNEELFDKVAPDLEGEILQQPIVTTSKGNIPMLLLVKDLRQDLSLRPNSGAWADEKKKNLARGYLNGMIAEYLLSWEAEDRKYEEKPPFKWSYDFYSENRLIKELESRLIAPEIKVSEEEIQNYYSEHRDEFSDLGVVSMAKLEDEEQLISKIWKEISLGQDFFEVANKYYSRIVPVLDVSIDRLTPDIRAVCDKLAVGEISPPFEKDEKFILVKLVDRKPGRTTPLAKEKQLIAKILEKEKFWQLRRKYTDTLLAQSDIYVNSKAWKKLTEELVD